MRELLRKGKGKRGKPSSRASMLEAARAGLVYVTQHVRTWMGERVFVFQMKYLEFVHSESCTFAPHSTRACNAGDG